MTVAEAVVTEAGAPGGAGDGAPSAPRAGGRLSPLPGRNGGQVARLRERIAEQRRQRGEAESALPRGVFSRVADDPDETDDIRTVGGYVSLPYAAELFEVDRFRLQKAVYRGALAGVKTDQSRTAPWMVRVRDVARFLAREARPAPRGGRLPGAKSLSPEERRYKAAAHEIWRKRHAPWMTPEESDRLAQRVAAIASGEDVRQGPAAARRTQSGAAAAE